LKGETENYKNSLNITKFYQYLILTSNSKSKKLNIYDYSRSLLSENYGKSGKDFLNLINHIYLNPEI